MTQAKRRFDEGVRMEVWMINRMARLRVSCGEAKGVIRIGF